MPINSLMRRLVINLMLFLGVIEWLGHVDFLVLVAGYGRDAGRHRLQRSSDVRRPLISHGFNGLSNPFNPFNPWLVFLCFFAGCWPSSPASFGVAERTMTPYITKS